MDRQSEIAAVVLACFAIGLGAALTPIRRAATRTIAIAAHQSRLLVSDSQPRPHGHLRDSDRRSAISLSLPAKHGHSLHADRHKDGWSGSAIRAGKVYLFVAGLVGLSWGLRPLVDRYISEMPQWALFWINSISAIVDNAATLTAAEIGPSHRILRNSGAF